MPQNDHDDGKPLPQDPATFSSPNVERKIQPGVVSPYWSEQRSGLSDEAVARFLPDSNDNSAIQPPDNQLQGDSGTLTWRDRLKGLSIAISMIAMVQTAQAEPPPQQFGTTQTTFTPQSGESIPGGSHDPSLLAANSQHIDFSSQSAANTIAGTAFRFDIGTSASHAGQVLDLQPERIVEVAVHIQTDKPSDAEVKDATDFLRRFEHEVHKKVVDPEKLADDFVSGGKWLLGVSLFMARKRLRNTTHNRLILWLFDKFDRISEAFEEATEKDVPKPRKRPIGFLADRMDCARSDAETLLRLTPSTEIEPGVWEHHRTE